MLTFGGYVDWSESLRFSLDGKIDEDMCIPADPLGLPVIFLNMLEQFPLQDQDVFKVPFAAIRDINLGKRRNAVLRMLCSATENCLQM